MSRFTFYRRMTQVSLTGVLVCYSALTVNAEENVCAEMAKAFRGQWYVKISGIRRPTFLSYYCKPQTANTGVSLFIQAPISGYGNFSNQACAYQDSSFLRDFTYESSVNYLDPTVALGILETCVKDVKFYGYQRDGKITINVSFTGGGGPLVSEGVSYDKDKVELSGVDELKSGTTFNSGTGWKSATYVRKDRLDTTALTFTFHNNLSNKSWIAEGATYIKANVFGTVSEGKVACYAKFGDAKARLIKGSDSGCLGLLGACDLDIVRGYCEMQYGIGFVIPAGSLAPVADMGPDWKAVNVDGDTWDCERNGAIVGGPITFKGLTARGKRAKCAGDNPAAPPRFK